MKSLSWLRVVYALCGMTLLMVTPNATGIQPAPTKADASISIYDDESSVPVFQHHRTVALFLGSEGFGADRAGVPLITHATLDPYVMAWSDDEGTYHAHIIDLIGILKAPKPRVYATMQDLYTRDEMPREDSPPPEPEKKTGSLREMQVPNLPLTTIQRDSKGENEWKVRKLDSFESKALGLLKTGHSVVWKDQGTTFRAVGAIRLQKSCVRCHEDKKIGDLLGAFTYFGFKSAPPPENERESARKFAELARQDPYSKEFIDARNNSRPAYDRNNRDGWPVPEKIFYIDRSLANMGIVTPGMVKRLKGILADLPVHKPENSEEEEPEDKVPAADK